ncbi:MAG: AAA family ATPase [Thermodesulfobacteriota bacterium]
MPIITLSRGCFSHGKEVAEKVAGMLGYKVLSRETLIEEAGQVYHVPEKELIKSIHDAPSVLDRVTHGREQYLCYIQAMLLEHVKNEDVVYHGHASHLLLPDIAHVFNVRILAEMADRIAFMQQSENISEKEAIRHISAEDTHRSRWAHYLYKMDITDPQMYDMVLKINKFTVEDAGRAICQAAQTPSFQQTPESRQALVDLTVGSRVKAAIANSCRKDLKVTVRANSGIVHIRAEAPNMRKTGYTNPKTEEYIREKMKKEISDEIAGAISDIPDIKNVVYEVIPPSYV